ncbi:MAG: AAA family ATPase [Rhodospirillales bacterium]|nr:AAA family ATPase [Rhodospirillales bacterium]
MTDTASTDRRAWVPPPSEEYQAKHPDWNTRPRGTRHGKLLVLSIADLETAPPRGYLLKGIMSPAELSLWVGPPKCGKSFLLLYIAYRLSLGLPVFGLRVKKCRVLYAAAEGQGGINKRIQALRDRYGASDNFHYIAQPMDLLHDTGHKKDLLAAAKDIKPDLIVLDTINRVLAGGDENSSADMGALVLFMAELREECGAHVAGVHHGTKANNGSGANPRGHSCLTGADDALIEVAKHDDGTRSAKVVHAKDDADGLAFAFKLGDVKLGEDADGDPITTLIVEEAHAAPPAAKASSLSPNEQIALSCLDQAIRTEGVLAVVGENPAERSVVTAAVWRQTFYRQGKPDEPQDSRKKAFVRARDALIAKRKVAAQDEYVWRPDAW